MKLARFIKDPVELQEVTDEIVSRYSELKDVFTGVVVAGGEPPDISQLSFLDYCSQTGITDVYLTSSVQYQMGAGWEP